MSITAETAKEHINDKAVLCCRAEAGVTLTASNLEDPALFDDLVDSGLLSFPDDALTIGQVLGSTLTKTCDSLVPLTPGVLDKVQSAGGEEKAEVKEEEVKEEKAEVKASPVAKTTFTGTGASQVMKLHIEEGKGIDLEIPVGALSQAAAGEVVAAPAAAPVAAGEATKEEHHEAKLMRELVTKRYKIDKVEFGDKTEIKGTTLILRHADELCKEAVETQELVEDMKLEIITPADYDKYSETIMDVQPIACKEEGDVGHGISRDLQGVVMVLTGTDANGVQIGEFGSSEGEMSKNIMWGRPGAPEKGEIFIKGQVTVKAGSNMERPGPLAAHKAFDHITEEIRKALKKVDDDSLVDTIHLKQYRRPGNKKVLIVKEIM